MTQNQAEPSFPTSSIDLSDLEASFGFLLRMAQVKSFEHFFANISEHVRPGEFTVLWLIWKNPGIQQGEAARALKIKRAHMTKLIQRMEREGFVRRTTSPNDQRVVLLSLSEAGAQHVETHKQAFLEVNSAKDSGLTPEEFRQLLNLLRKYVGLGGHEA